MICNDIRFTATLVMAWLLLCNSYVHAQEKAGRKDWVQLFNGKDIKDWIVKINHHEVGENFGNTFRVEDGIMQVRYDKYPVFDEQFGHLYYKQPFSYYHLVVEYRFVGEWRKDAPA